MNENYYLYISILIIIFVFLFHYYCQKNLYNNHQEKIKVKPLYDISHEYFGEIKNKNVYNFLCTTKYGFYDNLIVFIFILTIIYLFIIKDIHLISNSILTIAILFFIRTITFSLTILPTPSECNKPPFYTSGCGDLLFSGHYINLTVCMYILLLKTNFHILFKILLGTIYVLSIYFPLLCNKHYSVDIWLSIIISYLTSSLIIK